MADKKTPTRPAKAVRQTGSGSSSATAGRRARATRGVTAPIPEAVSVADQEPLLTAPVPHLSPDQRAARGKAARAETPRSSHAEWSPPDSRPDPIAVLEEQARSRVPELVPIRHGRMLGSPFAFFRGAAAVMAGDLAATPRCGLPVQLCGDAHLVNFGVFAAPDRRLVFDINDFDETSTGPWEWDVKRLVASIEIAARAASFGDKLRRRLLLTVVRRYRDAMADFAAATNLQVWYARLDPVELVEAWRSAAAAARPSKRAASDEVADRGEQLLDRARAKDSLRALSKLAHVVDGRLRIRSDPPLLVPLRELVEPDALDRELSALQQIYRAYRASLPNDRRRLLESYKAIDLARKVVGVGSVGTRSWIGLLLGRDEQDPLFLQFKEADESVLERYAGESPFANHGRRVVEGQRLMQAASDVMLGWTRVTGLDGERRDYYVRQLWDGKGSADVEQYSPEGFRIYTQMCAWTLARAHARSGDRIAIAAYIGSGDVFPQAIADFAAAYAGQNERDHQRLVAAVRSGRVVAETGV